MTEDQYIEKIHQSIQSAVQEAGGDWKRSFRDQTMQILSLIEEAYKEGLEDSIGMAG